MYCLCCFVALASAKVLSLSTVKSLNVYNNSIFALLVLFLLGIISIKFIHIDYEFDSDIALSISLISLVISIIVLRKRFNIQSLKTSVLGFIFGCTILISGTQFLIKNESLLNSPKKAIQFVNSDLKVTKNILVYNYLLASTEFYSDKNIITLNNGHNTVQRETQFETDLTWQTNLIDIRTAEGKLRTKKILDEKSVLLVRKRDQFKKYIKHIEPSFKNKKDFGTWVVYY